MFLGMYSKQFNATLQKPEDQEPDSWGDIMPDANYCIQQTEHQPQKLHGWIADMGSPLNVSKYICIGCDKD